MTLLEVSMSLAGDRSASLTEGECRALRLSAEGLLVPEVAEEMGTSPDAVRESLDSASRKLGARSKLEAIIIAHRRGEFDPLV